MSKPVYRKAETSDLYEIVDLYNAIIEEGGYSADLDKLDPVQRMQWFNELNTEEYGVYVVLDHDKIVGYFYFSPWRKGRRALVRTAEVSFYLRSSSRGSGTGKLMLEWISTVARLRNYRAILAILLDINLRSKHLLLINDFTVAGHLKDIVQLNDRTCGQFIMIRYFDN